MKKFATILVLLFVLSVSAFADGTILLGGRSCPQGQTCLFDGDIGLGGKSDTQDQTGLTDGDIHTGGLTDDSIFENVLDFLKSIF